MNTGFQLFQLQEIDSAIDEANRRIAEIEDLVIKDVLVDLAEDNLKICEKQYRSFKNDFDSIDHDIQSRKIKKKQSESSLYGGSIVNPKELQDLQKEIASLEAYISKADEELIGKLIELEESEINLLKAKENLHALQSSFETRKALLSGEKNQLTHSIDSLKEKRNSVISQIEQDLIAIYESLRNAKNGIAIARLLDNACSSCGASLTASQCQQTRSTAKLFYCPNCGRILYGS